MGSSDQQPLGQRITAGPQSLHCQRCGSRWIKLGAVARVFSSGGWGWGHKKVNILFSVFLLPALQFPLDQYPHHYLSCPSSPILSRPQTQRQIPLFARLDRQRQRTPLRAAPNRPTRLHHAHLHKHPRGQAWQKRLQKPINNMSRNHVFGPALQTPQQSPSRRKSKGQRPDR